MDVATAIRTRRSHKLFAGVPVSDAVLGELVELATWAPNHKFTEPWRFTVLPHRALPSLIAAVKTGLREPDGSLTERAQGQADKIAGILGPAGGAIAVRRVVTPHDAVRDREDYAACACAIQNIQLAAWERGVASYWTTSEAFIGPRLGPFWHVLPGEELVGVVVLGTAAATAKPVRYKLPEEVTIWLEMPEIGL